MTGSGLHTDFAAAIRAGGILKNSDTSLSAFEHRMRGKRYEKWD
jgi:hypothetical protein